MSNMKKSTPRGGHSNLPVPKPSTGTPGNSKSLLRGSNFAHSAEDIPRRVQYSLRNNTPSPTRRTGSPGNEGRSRLAVPVRDHSPQSGVRYITEDLIRKMAKEESLEMITTLNLTLSKENGKKIKYIENLDRCKKLTNLNMSCNMIERVEKLEKLIKLRELNLAYNNITKVEGLENLANLQMLNVTGNNIEHIPIWLGKRLKALRTLHLGKNNLQSMSELAKLKPLPDLLELTVADNPLCQIPHCRLYLVFHLRTLQVLDSQPVTEEERRHARDRFEQDEIEKLERLLETEEARNRKLEEVQNRSAQESSFSKAADEERKRQHKITADRLNELERELETKNDLLKKKTTELNKACEKHYQLEQELAFHNIDSKFDSLGTSPQRNQHDDSGALDESPYIGRARYKANQYSRENSLGVSPPQQARYHNVSASPQKGEIMEKIHGQLDSALADKQDKVSKTEDRLKRLTDDLMGTERKLLQATKDLKRMGDITEKDDVKVQLRQRMAKKMQLVNDLKDSATQIEEEIDKTVNSMHNSKVDVARLKGQLDRLDSNDPKYRKVYAEMVDKEQQISESNQMYGQLQQQLEVMLDTIAKETADIKKLELQLNDDHIDANESLRTELDEIVGGLQGYLSNVKQQGVRRQRDFDSILGEKSQLENKVSQLEQELSVMDAEAGNYKAMEQRLMEMEQNLSDTQNFNKTLEDKLHKTLAKDVEYQDHMENTSAEVLDLKRALKEAGRKSQYDKQAVESQLKIEKERATKALHQASQASAVDEENRRLQHQLEAIKAQNLSYKEQLEGERQSRVRETMPHNEIRKRLKDLSHSVKTGKTNVEPQDDRDYLGKTFKDLQHFMSDKVNKSFREAGDAKKKTSQADAEIQALKESLTKAENRLLKRDDKNKDKDNKIQAERKANEDEMKRMQNELQRLKAKLKDTMERAAQGRPVTKIVYRPESESDRSSMNSEEKALFDELQRELLELRRNMRNKEEENARKMVDIESEAAIMEQALRDQEKEYEKELAFTRDELEDQKEKQEARMQVIGQDLEQAQVVANQLRQCLDERDKQLVNEVQTTDMSNHMMKGFHAKSAAQEDELARLYEILDAQRDEIEHLNGMLDELYSSPRGPVNPGFDDGLWKLRQEVNRLKETLAMQSAYIQTMPNPLSSAGTQAQTDIQPDTGFNQNVYASQTGGPVPRLNLGTQPGVPVSMMPASPHRPNLGTAYSQPTAYMPAAGAAPGAAPGVHSGYASDPPQTRVSSARGSGHRPRSEDARQGHRSRRDRERGDDDRMSQRSHRSQRSHGSTKGRSGRSHDKDRRRQHTSSTAPKTAFEPVQRPQVYRPVQGGYAAPNMPSSAPSGVPTGAPMPGTSGQYFPSGGGVPVGAPMPGVHGQNFPMAGQSNPVGAPIMDGYQAPFPGRGVQLDPGASSWGVQPSGQRHIRGLTTNPILQSGGAGTQTPGYASTQTSGAPLVAMAPPYNAETQTYIPVAATPAQNVPYNSGRVFLPAYSTSTDRPGGRIYYPQGGRIPMGGPGGGGAPPPPPPPPPPAVMQFTPGSPGPKVSFLPVTPMATGTPVKHSRVNASLSAPPSPILAGTLTMDASGQPRGILKGNAGVDDDSYLFCNVPEHHDLEDYIAELQEKLKRLKHRILKEQEESRANEDHRLIKRLQNELEDRRDELEGLDLAIDKQKKSLKNLRKDERQLEQGKMEAKDELEFLKAYRHKSNKKKKMWKNAMDDLDSSDESLDEYLVKSRQHFVRNEVEGIEKTLSKRRSQLRDADALLRQCNTDLKGARDQARDTIDQYDSANHNLKSTIKETSELERRANQAGVELVKAADQLSSLRSEVKDMDRKRGKQERLLRDVNQVLSKRDLEYKDLDSRTKVASQNLSRLQSELLSTEQHEKQTLSSLRDAEDILNKRRSEIARMRDQHKEKIEVQRRELEKVDQLMGKKRTELQLIQDTAERKGNELNQVLRDAEGEINLKQRELRECREHLRDLEITKSDLVTAIKSKRGELSKVKEEVQTEDEVLQKLIGSVNKHKTELKHAYEMQKLEQTNLNSVKSTHAQKVSELEKTQRELIAEKAELEQLTAEINRKASELERFRQALDRDRQDTERLTLDKRSLEDRIAAMTREKEMLDDNCKSLDNKINQMKRTHNIIEEKMETSAKRLESLEVELRQREKEMDEANHQRTALQKEIHSLKQTSKETKSELKALKEHVREADDQSRHLEQDLREVTHQRDESKLEMERINEAIRTSRQSYEDYIRQEKQKHEDLQELLKSVAEKEFEYQEARMALSKVRKEVEREENKLNKLVSNANLELDNIRSDLHAKQLDLEQATHSMEKFKRETEQLQVNEEKFHEMDKIIKDLEREVAERNEEKSELAKALSRSYEELQKLRTEAAQDHTKTTRERLQMENAMHDMQVQLELAKQEMKHMQKRTASQVSELQNIAEVQFNKANRLDSEIARIRKDNKEMRKQLLTQNEILETEKMIEDKLRELDFNCELDDEIESQGPENSCQNGKSYADEKHVVDHDQSEKLERHLDSLKENLPKTSELMMENKENVIDALEDDNRKEDLREKLTQEQDYLRHQLQDQMQRHADNMESARLQSEGTIESLRTKLNTLQEVLVNTGESSFKSYRQHSRARSSSPGQSVLDTKFRKDRSPSPNFSRRGYLAQRPRSRSRSEERSLSPAFAEREFLTA
ncbi:centriolin-like isoform X3 [Mizuhopecten yessoensis]|uniref:centriolin-like isoform X3 n=1 Tax=Mizuhopecten yessoensis TaxID=6573 RepID=UPI000B457D28|nr:centriolin-like isoform X3 [Mizuhopecten yessoensis]